ncbi:MAG: glycoside hydrolase family 13 protein [Clostridia bacterium]|nr:glycoside hydrolase family 13 protein [Clostridia bacterium]
MRILFDSKNEKYKKPFGCVRQGEKCEFSIHIPTSCQTTAVNLIFETDDGFYKSFLLEKKEILDQYEIFGGSISIYDIGLYFYYFEISTLNSKFKLFKYGTNDTNIEEGEKWQLICFDENFDTPDWSKGAVYYQIFPDRFNISGKYDLSEKLTPYTIHNSTHECPEFLPVNGEILNNDFYGGTLKGIEEKIPYLKALGVNIIYLNPIFKAYSNHRYDTCDYKKIDPMLGNEEDFEDLCKSAHKQGVRIILDGVFSHTGSDSIYFDKKNRFGTGAYTNEISVYKNWYKFQNYPEKYDCWWGIETLPAIDKTNPDYINYIIEEENSVIEYWLKKGADGYRLDVADELGDKFIYLLNKKVKEIKKDAIVIGEVWEDASNKVSYGVRRKYLLGTELDSVMNYPFKNAIINLLLDKISPQDFENRVMTITENYPKPVLDSVMNLLSTHDTPRILTILGEADFSLSKSQKAEYTLPEQNLHNALERLYAAVFLEFTLPGSPSIYYGDEIGMQGFEDPFNRRFFDWGKTTSLLTDFYAQLAKIKNKHIDLKTGDIKFCSKDNVIKFCRGKLTCVLNLSVEPYLIPDDVLLSKNSECYSNKHYLLKYGFCIY